MKIEKKFCVCFRNIHQQSLQKLYEEAEAERSDLLYLEKKGLISLVEIEVWRDYESNLEENYPSEQILSILNRCMP